MTDLEKECERLRQEFFIDWIAADIPVSQMQTVYETAKNGWDLYGIYCGLIPNSKVEEVLSKDSWDFKTDQGEPGSVTYSARSGEQQTAYLRYGTDDGIEPLVVQRSFYGLKPAYAEVSEEFRHFHRLYHDVQANKFVKIDDAGNEQVVISIEPNRIRIRLKEIKQFLAIKEMYLAVYFDCRRDSALSLVELGLTAGCQDCKQDALTYSRTYGEFGLLDGRKAFCRILGKRLIAGFDKERSGFWGYAKEEPKRHVDFIIGVDQDGNSVMYSSDPDGLSNRHFSKQPTTPDYLTPVFFRKGVLDKYYQQPEKYSVEDGYLRCGYLWGLQMDNHHADKVVVWLGDLGRDLPYEETLHWKSFNVEPMGGVSDTFFKRQICAIATDTDQPDILFKHKYRELLEHSAEVLGWPLLRPLAPEDEHYFKALRIVAAADQKGFDETIQGLTKTLIDSINEKELVKRIPREKQGEIRNGIFRLEYLVANLGSEEYMGHIQFLRDLQRLRSTGSAHRKGRSYQKIAAELGLGDAPLSDFSRRLFEKAVEYVKFMRVVVDAISGRAGK